MPAGAHANSNTNQLNLGTFSSLWGGDLKLRNLKLKREALDKVCLLFGRLVCVGVWSDANVGVDSSGCRST